MNPHLIDQNYLKDLAKNLWLVQNEDQIPSLPPSEVLAIAFYTILVGALGDKVYIIKFQVLFNGICRLFL